MKTNQNLRWYIFFVCLLLKTGSMVFAQIPVFEMQTIDSKVAIGYGLALGDVDGDGKTDIILADKKQFVWYKNSAEQVKIGEWQKFLIAENLTEADNVCIAARDIDGDGKVEIAVGAQWNPSETKDENKSGAVFYLIRPQDPTAQMWQAVRLHHEPTVHRMRWVKTGKSFSLIVAPLHGRGNNVGAAPTMRDATLKEAGVKILAYAMPKNPQEKWTYTLLDESLHATHNLEVWEQEKQTIIFLGGKEGIKKIDCKAGKWQKATWQVQGYSFGEVRLGISGNQKRFIAGIEPMHGNELSVYFIANQAEKQSLFKDFNQGHALACADLLGLGYDQIVAGWRNPNNQSKVGIKLFVPDKDGKNWQEYTIDDNTMACEDLQIIDLDNDGDLDIVASGRATNNLVVYWNKRLK
jgi:FG-GAP-like repeat